MSFTAVMARGWLGASNLIRSPGSHLFGGQPGNLHQIYKTQGFHFQGIFPKPQPNWILSQLSSVMEGTRQLRKSPSVLSVKAEDMRTASGRNGDASHVPLLSLSGDVQHSAEIFCFLRRLKK